MFKGSIVALITPFHDDLTINYQKFEELIHWHIHEKTDGIVVCGTTGEASTLSDEEKINLFKYAVKVANRKIPIIAGTGSNDTKHALYLSEKAQEAGVDGLLLINPYYNKCNKEGMYQHFSEIAKKINLPIILYNVPSRTNAFIPIDIVQRLAKDHDNILGIKDASGDMNYSLKITEIPNFSLFSGEDNLTCALMAIGAKGVISVAANIIPNVYHTLCKLCAEENFKEARKIQIKYRHLVDMLFIEVNPIPIKEAMNLKGMQVGKYRLPLYPMEKENQKKLAEAVLEI